MLKSLGIFCSARMGNDVSYVDVFQHTAATLAKHQIQVVYGGSESGLMGVFANSVLRHDGKIIGVIPNCLKNIEFPHPALTELHYVSTLAERKELMCAKSDGFIMLPGGAGTLDEFFTMLVQVQVGIINKPCGILNINGYYDLFIQFLDHATHTGFIHQAHRDALFIDTSIEKLIERMKEKL